MTQNFTINTADVLSDLKISPQNTIPTFNLVDENNPILREVMPEFNFSKPPVDPNAFASSLAETCIKHKGFGLSANQCGFRYRVFVMGHGENFISCFNPKILSVETEEERMAEGCLSFPFMELMISRPKAIEVEYFDFTGTKHTAKFTGLTARVFQHELDHMNGIVYTNVCKPVALAMGLKKRNKLMKRLKLR